MLTQLQKDTKFFAPIEEIAESIHNNEGLCGLTAEELKNFVFCNEELQNEVEKELKEFQ